MPIYNYLCNKCSNSFELIQKYNEVENTKCPKCETQDVKREFIASKVRNFRFISGGYTSGIDFVD